MSELLKQVLIDKKKRNQIAARQIAKQLPAGRTWS